MVVGTWMVVDVLRMKKALAGEEGGVGSVLVRVGVKEGSEGLLGPAVVGVLVVEDLH